MEQILFLYEQNENIIKKLKYIFFTMMGGQNYQRRNTLRRKFMTAEHFQK